jgi:hypothetical protein
MINRVKTLGIPKRTQRESAQCDNGPAPGRRVVHPRTPDSMSVLLCNRLSPYRFKIRKFRSDSRRHSLQIISVLTTDSLATVSRLNPLPTSHFVIYLSHSAHFVVSVL